MSSLPDCFREVERSRGPVAMMRPRFPSESTRVKPAGVVRRGNCTIVVGEHDLWIARGADRLRVPPEARLYQDQGRLTLVVIGPKQAEIRVYSRLRDRFERRGCALRRHHRKTERDREKCTRQNPGCA